MTLRTTECLDTELKTLFPKEAQCNDHYKCIINKSLSGNRILWTVD